MKKRQDRIAVDEVRGVSKHSADAPPPARGVRSGQIGGKPPDKHRFTGNHADKLKIAGKTKNK